MKNNYFCLKENDRASLIRTSLSKEHNLKISWYSPLENRILYCQLHGAHKNNQLLKILNYKHDNLKGIHMFTILKTHAKLN